MSKETTPAWAKKLIKEVSSLSKDVGDLKKQTGINCSKLTALAKDTKKMSVQIDTLCRLNNNTETHLNRIERKVIKIEKKI